MFKNLNWYLNFQISNFCITQPPVRQPWTCALGIENKLEFQAHKRLNRTLKTKFHNCACHRIQIVAGQRKGHELKGFWKDPEKRKISLKHLWISVSYKNEVSKQNHSQKINKVWCSKEGVHDQCTSSALTYRPLAATEIWNVKVEISNQFFDCDRFTRLIYLEDSVYVINSICFDWVDLFEKTVMHFRWLP